MGTDIRISIEVLSDSGKWIEFNPSYPSWEGGYLREGGFEIPRSGIFFKALSFGTDVPRYDKVIKGLPEDVSEGFKESIADWDDLYAFAHLYFKDFYSTKTYDSYLKNVARPALESKGFEGERLEEKLKFLEWDFDNLSSKVCHHLNCAGFPYLQEGYQDRVRVVYGFY